MNVFIAGNKVESGLRKAVHGGGHSIKMKNDDSVDAIVWTDGSGSSVASKALASGTPVFYGGVLEGLVTSDKGFVNAGTGKTLLYVPYTRRVSGPFQTLAGQVAGGSVGDPGFIKVHSNRSAPKGVSVAGKGSCNAVVWNSLIHDIDWLQREFGPIKKVFAQGVQKSRPKLEYVMATFTLKGGVIAQVIHSYQSHGENTVRAEVCGTTGIVQYDSTLSPIRGFGDAQKSTVAGIDWAGQWSAFEAATTKRSVTKKVSGSYAVPVKIAGLVLQSIRGGAPKTV